MATTHIFQSGVRNWPASMRRCEIEVFNPQAWDSCLKRESWQVYIGNDGTIGNNGIICSNGKAPYSNGSTGEYASTLVGMFRFCKLYWEYKTAGHLVFSTLRYLPYSHKFIMLAVVFKIFLLKERPEFLPVGSTMAIHKIMGSVQKSFTDVEVWPIQKLIIVRIPRRTVVSRCFMPLPNNWQIC